MIDRRTFIGAFAAGLVVARSAAEAQPAAKIYRIGFLLVATAETVAPLVHALTEGLRDLGYVELPIEQPTKFDRPEDGQGARSHYSAIAAAARGRGDPINADPGRYNQRSRSALRRRAS